MNEIKLTVTVSSAATHLDPAAISSLLTRLIGCGVEDAKATLDDGNCALEDDAREAKLATELEISVSERRPRVLVIVAGGVADPISDDGIDVEIFDCDDHQDDPDNYALPPAHFADLAASRDVSVAA